MIWSTGRRAWWLMVMKIPMITQLAMSDDPPWLMNGVVRPVRGSNLVLSLIHI